MRSSGNISPVVLRDAPVNRLAFVTYFKGEYGLHVLERKDEITKVASADFGTPGPIVDFQAPLTHTIVADNKKKKGKFEKLFLEGRPPVALGVTSGGDVFGGTQVTFTDVLGDQQFSLLMASVSQYRTMSFTWLNMERRMQWAHPGLQPDAVLLRPARRRLLRSGVQRPDRSRSRRGDPDHPGRQRVRDLSVQSLPPRRGVRRLQPLPGALQRSAARADLASSTSRSSSAAACSTTAA